MKLAPEVQAVQRHYPQIYLACHTRHGRAASSPVRLSARDSAVLAHLDPAAPVDAAGLARHLGVARSTMSAALKKLERLGYVTRRRDPRDARRVELRLSAAGAKAMSAASVLEAARVARVLARLRTAERAKALAGLALLARASREEMLGGES
jgi:DNA-binding MarR family transcriptional regulator